MSEAKHFKATIDGVCTHWWVYNPDAQRTLVAVHGFRGTHHGLARIAEALPDYRVIVPDVPGFGASRTLANMTSLTSYTKWLAAFITAVSSHKKVILLSHSFGTIIASHYAADHPERVQKLVLINPIADARKPLYDIGFQITQAYYAIGQILPESIAVKWLRNKPCINLMSFALSKSPDPDTRSFTYAQHHAYFGRFSSRDSVLAAYRLSTHHDVSEVAARITPKTLLITGQSDAVAPRSSQLHLRRKIRSSVYIEIPKLGHLLPYEAPQDVATAIVDFLKAGDK